MNWIFSQELAKLLGWKTPFSATGWAKKEGISYFRKGSGYCGRYWFNKKEILVKLKENKKIVTTKEAAAILGVHLGTFKRWERQGHIKSIGRGKRNTSLFKKTQIVNFQPKTGAWVSWQERTIVRGYNIMGLFREELAQKIGKTIWAIGSKASHLGLGKYNQREFYFLKDVADLLQTNRSRVKRWIKSGKLEAAPRYSSAGRIRYRISEENIAKFMTLYPQNWQDLKPIINLLALPEYKKFNCAKNYAKT